MRHRGFWRCGIFTVDKLTQSCDQTGRTVGIKMSWNTKKKKPKKPSSIFCIFLWNLLKGRSPYSHLLVRYGFVPHGWYILLKRNAPKDTNLKTRLKTNIFLELPWLLWAAAASVLVRSTLLKLHLHLTGAAFKMDFSIYFSLPMWLSMPSTSLSLPNFGCLSAGLRVLRHHQLCLDPRGRLLLLGRDILWLRNSLVKPQPLFTLNLS